MSLVLALIDLGVAATLLAIGATAVTAQVDGGDNELVVLAEPCLYLRPGPGPEFEPVRCLPPGRRVTLLESRAGWGQVRLPDDQVGWVALRLLGPATEVSSPPPRATSESRPAPPQLEALEAKLALLRRDHQTALAAKAQAEQEASRRIAELEQALASAETERAETVERSAALRTEIEALRGETANLARINQELEAAAAAQESSQGEAQSRIDELEEDLAAAGKKQEKMARSQDEAQRRIVELERALAATGERQEGDRQSRQEDRRRIAELEGALASAEAERARLAAERAELQSEHAELVAEAAAEAQREIEALGGRLGAAEMFLAESERQRRELARQLFSLRTESDSPPERVEETPTASPAAEAAPRTTDAGEAEIPAANEILAMVNAWAEAWSKQRVEDYLSFYAETFVPPDGQSRQRWESVRRERLRAPSPFNVEVALLALRSISPDRAEVEFIQSYTSDTYSDVVVKTLQLIRESGRWKIARETAE